MSSSRIQDLNGSTTSDEDLTCSLRTNLPFVLIFAAAMLGFCLAVTGFWCLAEGAAIGVKLLVGPGGGGRGGGVCGGAVWLVFVGCEYVCGVGFA
jgi:hypothetical protein